MNCYIEFVLIDNIVINYILLCAALKICRQNFLKRRLLLSALLGAAFAVVMPFVILPTALLFLIKVSCGLLIIYTAKSYKMAREYLFAAALFFLLTFALGGLILGVFFMLKVNYSVDFSLIYISKIPMGLVLLAAFLLYVLVIKVTKKLYRKKNLTAFIYKCRLYLGGAKIEVDGFLDSGNSLYYKSSQPVHILGTRAASCLFKDGFFDGKTKASYLDFQTISGKGRMLCFEADKLEIYKGDAPNTIYNIILGISPYHIKGDEGYGLILHPSVF